MIHFNTHDKRHWIGAGIVLLLLLAVINPVSNFISSSLLGPDEVVAEPGIYTYTEEVEAEMRVLTPVNGATISSDGILYLEGEDEAETNNLRVQFVSHLGFDDPAQDSFTGLLEYDPALLSMGAEDLEVSAHFPNLGSRFVLDELVTQVVRDEEGDEVGEFKFSVDTGTSFHVPQELLFSIELEVLSETPAAETFEVLLSQVRILPLGALADGGEVGVYLDGESETTAMVALTITPDGSTAEEEVVEDPETGERVVTTIIRDADGNIIKRIDTYYDEDGVRTREVVTEYYPGGGEDPDIMRVTTTDFQGDGLTPSTKVVEEYDEGGTLTSLCEYTYDSLGRLTMSRCVEGNVETITTYNVETGEYVVCTTTNFDDGTVEEICVTYDEDGNELSREVIQPRENLNESYTVESEDGICEVLVPEGAHDRRLGIMVNSILEGDMDAAEGAIGFGDGCELVFVVEPEPVVAPEFIETGAPEGTQESALGDTGVPFEGEVASGTDGESDGVLDGEADGTTEGVIDGETSGEAGDAVEGETDGPAEEGGEASAEATDPALLEPVVEEVVMAAPEAEASIPLELYEDITLRIQLGTIPEILSTDRIDDVRVYRLNTLNVWVPESTTGNETDEDIEHETMVLGSFRLAIETSKKPVTPPPSSGGGSGGGSAGGGSSGGGGGSFVNTGASVGLPTEEEVSLPPFDTGENVIAYGPINFSRSGGVVHVPVRHINRATACEIQYAKGTEVTREGEAFEGLIRPIARYNMDRLRDPMQSEVPSGAMALDNIVMQYGTLREQFSLPVTFICNISKPLSEYNVDPANIEIMGWSREANAWEKLGDSTDFDDNEFSVQVNHSTIIAVFDTSGISQYDPLAECTDDTNPWRTPFKDVNFHWSIEFVCKLYKKGAISGYTAGPFAGTFQPDRPVTRAELLKIIMESEGYELPEEAVGSIFPDVTKEQWFTQYVEEAARRGIVEGYPDGSFRPFDFVNRAEALKIILGAAKKVSSTDLLNEIVAQNNDDDTNAGLADVSEGLWFSHFVSFAVKNGIIGGKADGNFYAGDNMTRAEVSKVVQLVSELE